MKNLEDKVVVSKKPEDPRLYILRNNSATNLTGIYKGRSIGRWPIGEYTTSMDQKNNITKACATIAKYNLEKNPQKIDYDSLSQYCLVDKRKNILFSGDYIDLLKRCGIIFHKKALEDISNKYTDILTDRKKIKERRSNRALTVLDDLGVFTNED